MCGKGSGKEMWGCVEREVGRRCEDVWKGDVGCGGKCEV